VADAAARVHDSDLRPFPRHCCNLDLQYLLSPLASMENWNKEWLPHVECPNCNFAVPFQNEIPVGYFHGRQTEPCGRCGKPFDWWGSILKGIKENFMMTRALVVIGARSTLFKVVLDSENLTKINLTDHGVPADAKILSVDYTPQTPMWYPTEILGNRPFKYRRERLVSHILELYPWPVETPLKAVPEMVVNAVWLVPVNDDESWTNLLDAFIYYIHDEYQSVIIPANTAVECALGKLLGGWLTRVASKDYVENFLKDGATYGHQLNVLLPALLTCLNGPVLRDDLRGLLNRLRTLRNKIVHEGTPPVKISKDDCAEVLCAALFGVHYVQLIKPYLDPVAAQSDF